MNFVTTVLRSGGEYTPEHVAALKRNLDRCMTESFVFVVLTDMVPQVEAAVDNVWCLALWMGWPGWWSKLELFRRGLPWEDGGRVIYMDLDTVLVGDLPFPEEPFVMLRGFRRNRWASGLMSWEGALPEEPFTKMIKANSGMLSFLRFKGGDQAFIQETLQGMAMPVFWQQILPGGVVSYKWHCRAIGRPPEGARVVCFHGEPRPWEVEEKWVKEARR